MNRRCMIAVVVAASFGAASPSFAQNTIKIPNIIELSGAGATVGNNWKNGSIMAVEEINAAGGILGKKIELEFVDTPSRRIGTLELDTVDIDIGSSEFSELNRHILPLI